ncbi:hypothetical protein F4Y93_06195 [Candidatus Poribacteria bacterium]|nr:hypothetical protein [Candidatus Poribacteria bacterium]
MMHSTWHEVAHSVVADLLVDVDEVERHPVLKPMTGVYRLEIKCGILMPSPYSDVWAFCDPQSGELIAFFAEYEVWLSMLPNAYAQRFARAGNASQYDMPTWTMEGLPVLMSRQSLYEGLIGPARVPVQS